MNCPHCSASLALDAAQCRFCGFCATAVRSVLGAEWVRLERLTDASGALSLKEHRQLETVLDDFERSFPQCFFAVYLGSLPASLTAGDLGFWLVNHGAFQTQQIAKRNDYGVALVIDTQHQSVSLTHGYALEKHVRNADSMHILNQLGSLLDRHRYGLAVEQAVKLFGKKLMEAGTRTLPHIPAGTVADLGEMGLQPLRASHRSLRVDSKG